MIMQGGGALHAGSAVRFLGCDPVILRIVLWTREDNRVSLYPSRNV